MERYDWILLAITIALIGGGLVGTLTSAPMEYGLVAGFVLATPFVYDAIPETANPNGRLPSSHRSHRMARVPGCISSGGFQIVSTGSDPRGPIRGVLGVVHPPGDLMHYRNRNWCSF